MATTNPAEPPKKPPPATYRKAFIALGGTDSWEARDGVPREHEIKEMIQEIAKKRHIKVPPVYIYESDKPNAVSMPGGVGVATNLIDITTPQQMKGVLGHEISHTRHRWRDAPIMLAILGTTGLLISMAFEKIWTRRPPKTKLGTLGLYAAQEAAVLTGAAMAIKPYGMFMEYEADHEGAQIAGPQHMAGALTALEKRAQELNRTEPPTWIQRVARKTTALLFDVHPATSSRLERLRRMEAAQQTHTDTPRTV